MAAVKEDSNASAVPAAVRADVEQLAAMTRRSASPGERRSAEWLARRLADAGAADVDLASFRFQSSFGLAQGLHFAVAAVAAVLGRRGLAAASLASFELEYSGRRQWLRRLLPAGEGTSVVARLAARGRRSATVVLVAHHDAANTGLIWHPRLLAAGDARAARTGRRPSLALLSEAAMVAASLSRLGLTRAVAAGLLLTAAGLSVEVERGGTVPGANDNASGVAAVVSLVEQLAEQRPEGLEVVVVLPGCEESGMGGMAAWLRRHGAALDPGTTLVVGLDTIGSGEPVALEAEGGLWPVRYRDEDVRLAERAAQRIGVPLRRWRLGAWTDPVLARLAGLRTVSLVSVRDGGFPEYHRPTDTPEIIDWQSVANCQALAQALIEDWAAEPQFLR